MDCFWCRKSILKEELYIKRVSEDEKLYFCSDECFIGKMFSLPMKMVEVFEEVMPNLPTIDLADVFKLIDKELKSNRKIVKSGNTTVGLRRKKSRKSD